MLFNINNGIQFYILGYRNLSKFTSVRLDILHFWEIIFFVNNGNRVSFMRFLFFLVLYFESDLNATNSSGVKFKGTPL